MGKRESDSTSSFHHCSPYTGAMRGSWWCSAFLLAAVISVSASDWSCVTQSDSVQEAWQSCPLQDEDRAGGSGARVRDSHQLSSSNGLGEEHNTEPKTNAAAASNGKILFYQRQLFKCPNSALKCPSSASAAKKSNQWKQTKTGKQALQKAAAAASSTAIATKKKHSRCPELFNPYEKQ